MLFKYAALSDIGTLRSVQQDRFLVIPQLILDNSSMTDELYYDSKNGAIFIVADGMGGGVKGELAAELAIDAAEKYILKHKNLLVEDSYTLVNEIIYSANQKVLDYLSEHPEDKGMGSTLVLGIFLNSELYLGWVGDSRCYGISGDEIIQLSHDHSYVQTLVDDGVITEHEAFNHPNRNIINQSLGMASVIPSYKSFIVKDFDKIIFCSDGLNSMLVDEEIFEIANINTNVNSLAQELINAANEAGGDDNITCIVLELNKINDGKVANIQSKIPTVLSSNKTVRTVPKLLWLGVLGILLTSVFVMFLVSNQGKKKNINFGLDEQSSINNDEIPKEQEVVEIEVIPTMDEEENLSETYQQDGVYSVRLKVFSDSLKAVDYLQQIANNGAYYASIVNRDDNHLYEVIVSGFDTKDGALNYITEYKYSDAIIIYKNINK